MLDHSTGCCLCGNSTRLCVAAFFCLFWSWMSAEVPLVRRAGCCKRRSMASRSSGPDWASAGAAQAFKRSLQSQRNLRLCLCGHMLQHLPPPCCSRSVRQASRLHCCLAPLLPQLWQALGQVARAWPQLWRHVCHHQLGWGHLPSLT